MRVEIIRSKKGYLVRENREDDDYSLSNVQAFSTLEEAMACVNDLLKCEHLSKEDQK